MAQSESFPSIPLESHIFSAPRKCINSHADLPFFLNSRAHKLIVNFILHLSTACTPPSPKTSDTEAFFIDSPTIHISPTTEKIISLLEKLENFIEEAPPDEGPRRFGNTAFRTWHKLVEERLPELLKEHLPHKITQLPAKEQKVDVSNSADTNQPPVTASEELGSYLLGSFGSASRLDYGTGHELSFLAFICGLWVLGAFELGKDELGVAFHAFNRYLMLVRKLILLYNLEPAGSHGVWGLDDHSFLPYIFGSAQLAATPDAMGPPTPGSIIEENTVQRERKHNLYFGAIGFIRDVKKGPFWEHSPYLFDISGVAGGWKKINSGMMKMYSAEVLGKFPVVQHFPFGSIFQWELVDGIDASSLRASNDPHQTSMTTNLPSTSMPDSDAKVPFSAAELPTTTSLNTTTSASNTRRSRMSTPVEGSGGGGSSGTTYAKVPGGTAPTIAGIPVTTAPWAKAPTGPSGVGTGSGAGAPPLSSLTSAPWAKPGGGAQGGRPGVVGHADTLSAMGPPGRPVGVTAMRGTLPDRRPAPDQSSTGTS